MNVEPDLELLREYAESRSEEAFTKLVHRHLNFVYSTALRIVNENQLAEDVAQVVFLRLARKAPSLSPGTILTGWLYRTTQFVARTAQRSEWRRRKRETRAMEFMELHESTESVWKEVAPLLEPAVAQLRKPDQNAVLLRFFAGKSLREVGEALGISDDAAQKRVNRAVEKMRDYFVRHGVTASAASIAPAIAAHAVQMAPAGLASTLATGSLSGGAGIASSALSLLKAIGVVKTKMIAAVTAATLVLFTGTVAVVHSIQQSSNPLPASSAAPALVLRGTVRTPDGKPLPGALVRVATPESYLRLYQTTNSFAITNSAGKPRVLPASTRTGPDGTFLIELPQSPKEGLAAVVVNSDVGYALVTGNEMAANSDIIVQPWASIEGVLRIGRSVGSNQTVNLGIWGSTPLYDWNLVSHGAGTTTDENGRFVFPRVAPVDIWLTHLVAVRSNDWRQSGHHYVKVSPGDHVTVQLGGDGRAIVGHISGETTNQLVFYGSMWANQTHPMRPPRGWRNMSRDEQRQLEREWRDSPEGELWKQEVRNYEFAVRPDGTFRVEDVLPATYRMQIRADAPRIKGQPSRLAASAEIEIEVPVSASNDPIDVGVLSPVTLSP